MVREFSYRYKSLIGVEGRWDGAKRQFTLRVVAAGVTLGVTGGISVEL